MPPKPNRYRLLLDEMFPRRKTFPQLNKLHDLKHVLHDFHLEDNQDENVVKLAKFQKRILISKNKKHMIQLCESEQVTLICITETMDWEEIDKVIMATLRKIKPSEKVVNLSRPIRKIK
ncbi:MAG: DUF5615 family PIN-like protein [Microgenomates group bacterium]